MSSVPSAHELWFTVYSWLGSTGNKLNKNFCKQEISTHPDYPALTAVTDFLDAGGMTYNAVQADASYIHEFNYPLLAHIMQLGNEQIHIINKATDWDAQNEMTQHWSGIVIYPEKNSDWHHADNDAYSKKQNRSKQNSYLLAAAALAFLFIAIFRTPVISFALMAFLSLAGLIVSILITGTEMGVQSTLVKQVCGAVSNGGCERVLRTNYAKGIAGFSTGDIAIIYFSTQFVLLLASVFYPLLLNTVLLISLSGLAVAGWSIYTQAVQIKQWCALCIGVVAVLLLQFTIAVLVINFGLPVFSLTSAAIFIGLAVFNALLLYPVKQLLKTNYANEQKLAELKKWKMDGGLFLAQWRNEQAVDTTVWENDLLIGNPAATFRITVACNPYCTPCARAHKQLDEMLKRFNDILCVQVRFLCDTSNEEDIRTTAVRAILQKAKELGNRTNRELLTDWFENMNYENWIQKWQPDWDLNVAIDLKKHEEWCNKSHIAFTPTFFMNGKKLPGRYELTDLEFFMPLLTDLINNIQGIQR